MAKTIKVKPNQSISDVVIQATGSMEACMQFCKDNTLVISDVPIVGTVYKVSNAALVLGDDSVLKYFQSNNIVIGTLGTVHVQAGYITEDASETYVGEDGVAYVEE